MPIRPSNVLCFECTECRVFVVGYKARKQHELAWAGHVCVGPYYLRELHACATCSRRFAHRSGLLEHCAKAKPRAHEPEPDVVRVPEQPPGRVQPYPRRLFGCDKCGSFFTTEPKFDEHKQTHRPEHDLTCRSCSRVFKTSKELSDHIQSERHAYDPKHAEALRTQLINFAVQWDAIRSQLGEWFTDASVKSLINEDMIRSAQGNQLRLALTNTAETLGRLVRESRALSKNPDETELLERAKTLLESFESTEGLSSSSSSESTGVNFRAQLDRGQNTTQELFRTMKVIVGVVTSFSASIGAKSPFEEASGTTTTTTARDGKGHGRGRFSGTTDHRHGVTSESLVQDSHALDGRLCLICLEREKCVASPVCHHMMLCKECFDQLMQGPRHSRTCPVCRTSLKGAFVVMT